jgi:Flp pilus assembly protein TadG
MAKQQLTATRRAAAGPGGRRRGNGWRGRRGNARRGLAMLYVLVLLTILFALASFAVDYGRVQLAKTQLRAAVDDAAKWGALAVKSGKNTVLSRCNAAAAENTVDGVAPSFSLADVQLGSWNAQTRVFTNEGKPYNAVKLTGTQVIPLMLGSVVQKPSVTIRVSAVARTSSLGGVIGLNGIVFHNNAFIGSYDSSVTTAPTEANANSNAVVYSNAVIEGKNNGTIKGDLLYGPDGSVDVNGWNVTGSTTPLQSNISVPAVPAWNPTANPGSITNGDYVHNGGALNGGTYWFNSLTINAPLSFNGPATVHVNGNIVVDGNDSDITAYQSRPPNLTIYQIGNNRTFVTKNSLVLTALLVAPTSDFEAMNKADFYGLAIFKTITLKNTARIFFDETAAIERAAALVQ